MSLKPFSAPVSGSTMRAADPGNNRPTEPSRFFNRTSSAVSPGFAGKLTATTGELARPIAHVDLPPFAVLVLERAS